MPTSIIPHRALSNQSSKFSRLHHLIRPLSTKPPLFAEAPPSPSPSSQLITPPPPRRSPLSPAHQSRLDFARTLAKEIRPNNPESRSAARARHMQSLEKASLARDLSRQAYRKWEPSTLYSPHDLGPVEQAKSKIQMFANRENVGLGSQGRDAFDVLGIDPRKEWKNVVLLSEFVSETGRIRHRKETGLRNVNQRRVAKAIRRAIGMGFMPSVHKHPEMLERERREINVRRFGVDGREGRVLTY